MRLNSKTITLLLVVALSSVACNKQVKYKKPKRIVAMEVSKAAVKKELDTTPITDYYSISGTTFSVSIQIKLTISRDVRLLRAS